MVVFCEHLTNVFNCSAFFLCQPVPKITTTCPERDVDILDILQYAKKKKKKSNFNILICKAEQLLVFKEHLCSTSHIMTRNIFIVLLCFKIVITYIVSLEPFQIQGYNTTLVLQFRKLRPGLDHCIPAFPLTSHLFSTSLRDRQGDFT